MTQTSDLILHISQKTSENKILVNASWCITNVNQYVVLCYQK